MLVPYQALKRAETFALGTLPQHNISCQPPKIYAERFVGFAVIFYTLAKGVQDFWRWPLFLGQLKYDMSRTQSIMRVATTASPVSGAGVRTRMIELGHEQVREWGARLIQHHWGFYRRLSQMAKLGRARSLDLVC